MTKIYCFCSSCIYYHFSCLQKNRFTLLEHMKSPPVFGRVRVAQHLAFYVMLCVLLFVFWSFSFLPQRSQFIFDIWVLMFLWYLSPLFYSVSLSANDFAQNGKKKYYINQEQIFNFGTVSTYLFMSQVRGVRSTKQELSCHILFVPMLG